MSFVSRLLQRLGLARAARPRKYALDASTQPVLESLAERQQRSPDEVVSNLVEEAISRRQVDANMWRRGIKKAAFGKAAPCVVAGDRVFVLALFAGCGISRWSWVSLLVGV